MALTIPGAVASAAREFGDATALADPGPDGLRLSYRELGERVTAVAAALVAEGVAPGDRVAVCGRRMTVTGCWPRSARSARAVRWSRSARGSPAPRRWT